MAGKSYAYFVVADPRKDDGTPYRIIEEPFNYDITETAIEAALEYWNENIFPELLEICKP